ncbi:MAG: Phage SPO1 DNA polymerase-related protein [Candidatus Moranbacteria bacterium GW2011_GWE1_35_17]|nr:MAG: Phage SPO1 DNA polymerase-related protein [Candidatus Moranbacteria bacterium GW2011_GWE2_35_164]KKP68000.1 MAG: Phage SPO1 DNA polymerase-related protein [Candidatus Moranbacteria bacterium GW2011_GWE1_35_17]KKP83968.1 MAG: Phage SPO1 DNA polymerase-related protein [Candidatus Moranbacteria bacterium GW2011_GWF2_35_54]
MNKEKLEKLNKEMLACTKCALSNGCKQVVPGAGSANAQIMFIGEAPGKKEDELGAPFVGAAGKFLDEMLAIIKLKREDVYIANTVKCRPIENRDPSQEEKDICWPWLEKQIAIIQPKIIVTLGRHSMNLFLPELKISEAHGKAIKKDFPEIGEQTFFTLYHPAAALYNGGLRQTLIKDFKKIPKVLRETDKG